MTVSVCRIRQIAEAKFDEGKKKIKINGIEINDALIFGKVISVQENKQLILDHEGYKDIVLKDKAPLANIFCVFY